MGQRDHLATHEEVAAVLTREAVLGTWASAVSETGNLTRCTGTRLELRGGEPLAEGQPMHGTVVGVTTLECESGTWQGRGSECAGPVRRRAPRRVGRDYGRFLWIADL